MQLTAASELLCILDGSMQESFGRAITPTLSYDATRLTRFFTSGHLLAAVALKQSAKAVAA